MNGEPESCTHVEGAAGDEFVFVIGIISDESRGGEAKGYAGETSIARTVTEAKEGLSFLQIVKQRKEL